jgi:hypothetical protein
MIEHPTSPHVDGVKFAAGERKGACLPASGKCSSEKSDAGSLAHPATCNPCRIRLGEIDI